MANMVHSMAGGKLGQMNVADFAKVKILEKEHAGEIYWFLSIPGLKQGDKVIVPLDAINEQTLAQVLRIDYSVSSFNSPIPFKRAKKIIKRADL